MCLLPMCFLHHLVLPYYLHGHVLCKSFHEFWGIPLQGGTQIHTVYGAIYPGVAWLESLAGDFGFTEGQRMGEQVVYTRRWEATAAGDESSEPLEVTLTPLTRENLQHIQSLEAESLPLKYSAAFYERLFADHMLVRLAKVGQEVAGSLSAERIQSERYGDFVYLKNLCVRPTFRRHRVAESLVAWLLEHVKQSHNALVAIYAHTEISNKPVLAMATKMNFRIIGFAPDQYQRPANPHAYALCWCKPGRNHPLPLTLLRTFLDNRPAGSVNANIESERTAKHNGPDSKIFFEDWEVVPA
ncbi:unnamed protein product [Durusdinium trenchii]|uniref:N-acetyltransferase domain-containing protein n=1 Tax=Durusdinium trenchii TaxID=1381693 RepID=A0ABP0NIX2_9DINO